MINPINSIIDFHAHILPRADHGSSSVDISIFQLNSAKKSGVQKIIATPHFYPNEHFIDSFLRKRNKSYEALLPYLTDELPEVKVGAEVLLCANIDKLPGIEKLCVYGTNVLLIELPFTGYSDEHFEAVYNLIKNGFQIVLAHADRYPPSDIDKLLTLDLSLQINADSLTRIIKNKKIYQWIETGRVCALGSDIHGKDNKAYKRLISAAKKTENYLDQINFRSQMIWENSK